MGLYTHFFIYFFLNCEIDFVFHFLYYALILPSWVIYKSESTTTKEQRVQEDLAETSVYLED